MSFVSWEPCSGKRTYPTWEVSSLTVCPSKGARLCFLEMLNKDTKALHTHRQQPGPLLRLHSIPVLPRLSGPLWDLDLVASAGWVSMKAQVWLTLFHGTHQPTHTFP